MTPLPSPLFRRPIFRHSLQGALAIYVVVVAGYLGASGTRLRGPSSDTHFSYQARMFLQHRLDLGTPPPSSNDWAEVEYLSLKDGRAIAGSFLRSQPGHFRRLDGHVETIDDAQIKTRFKKYYVSFPPLPTLLFLPLVAIWGLRVNDVLVTALLAAVAPALLFLVLRRLAARGDSERSEREDLLITSLFAFGTVYFYSSVLGQVWYTAHVVATVLTGLFVLASLEAAHPLLSGVCLGAIVLTRPQMIFWGIFFVAELWRRVPVEKRLRKAILWLIPIALFGVAAAAFNYARFHSFGEFGHSYLNVRWTDRIQRYGLFNFAFLARNLAAAFVLTPRILGKAPYVQISWHGLSMLITTPALLYLVWPLRRPPLHRVLWAVVVPIALLSLLYQNDGWVQFGFRFSNDYLFGLMMLLAIGGRPLGRLFITLLLFSIAVNLFGAITFGRAWQYYFDGFFTLSPGEL